MIFQRFLAKRCLRRQTDISHIEHVTDFSQELGWEGYSQGASATGSVISRFTTTSPISQHAARMSEGAGGSCRVTDEEGKNDGANFSA